MGLLSLSYDVNFNIKFNIGSYMLSDMILEFGTHYQLFFELSSFFMCLIFDLTLVWFDVPSNIRLISTISLAWYQFEQYFIISPCCNLQVFYWPFNHNFSLPGSIFETIFIVKFFEKSKVPLLLNLGCHSCYPFVYFTGFILD